MKHSFIFSIILFIITCSSTRRLQVTLNLDETTDKVVLDRTAGKALMAPVVPTVVLRIRLIDEAACSDLRNKIDYCTEQLKPFDKRFEEPLNNQSATILDLTESKGIYSVPFKPLANKYAIFNLKLNGKNYFHGFYLDSGKTYFGYRIPKETWESAKNYK